MSAAKWGGLTALGVGGLAGIGSVATKGFKDTITGVGEWLGLGASDISTTTVVGQTENMLYKMIAMLARGLKLLGVKGGIPEAMMDFANQGIVGAKNPEANGGWGPNGPGGADLGSNGPSLGTAAVAAPIGVALATGGYAAYQGVRGRGGPGGGSPSAPAGGGAPVAPAGGGAPGATNAARTVAREGAEEAVEAVARGAGRFGRFGKILALGGTAAVGVGLLGGNEAEAATLPGAGTARNGSTLQNLDTGTTVSGGGVGTLQAAGAEVAGLGLSIVGARTAAETVAHAAAPVAARLGLQTVARSIPGISSIYAAGETVYNVGSDLLRGDFKKAGLNLVSGVGETVAGLGGALTYFTLGTAWREGVRGAGAMAFGEENTINHSLAVEVGGGVGSWLKEQFFGATSGTPSAAAQPSLRRDNTGPAFAF